MKILVIIIAILAITFLSVQLAHHFFYKSFEEQALNAKQVAGKQDEAIINEFDLKAIPLPVANYLRFSGLVGKQRISYIHLTHEGTFKPGVDKEMMPIEGEYYLTTKEPSFNWFGTIKMFPGITISAFDSYQNGEGKMIIKFMSIVKIAKATGYHTNISALGRCFAEMTMCPSFFLDEKRIVWTEFDSTSASCIFSDKDLSAKAKLFFNPDHSLKKIEVNRYYDNPNGKPTLEKFTGVCSSVKDFNGLKIPTVYDGIWNLRSGDFHYVHFVIKNVQYE